MQTPLGAEPVTVAPDAVLLVDGVFLLRPELRDRWTLRVYVHVSEAVTLERALARDVARFGSTDTVLERYRHRYLPGQARYRADASPAQAAHIVIDNSDAEAPSIVRWEPGDLAISPPS